MIEQIFLQSAIKRFKEYKALGEKTFEQLSEAQIQQQPNEASNSIAITIQHLHGNMLSRWTNFLTEDGEKPWRNRDAEFEVQPQSKEQLLQQWNDGWQVVLQTLESLQPEDLAKNITIRTQPLVVVDAINRQLAHYSYHVGQMVYLGKWLKNGDWQSLSIPKGASQNFNEQIKTSKH
jgi:hypothetical protein